MSAPPSRRGRPHSRVCVRRAPGGAGSPAQGGAAGSKWAEDRDRPSPNKTHGRRVSASGKGRSNCSETPPRTVGMARSLQCRRPNSWLPPLLSGAPLPTTQQQGGRTRSPRAFSVLLSSPISRLAVPVRTAPAPRAAAPHSARSDCARFSSFRAGMIALCACVSCPCFTYLISRCTQSPTESPCKFLPPAFPLL